MTSVAFEYPSNTVEAVTQDTFRLFFKGSELVVAGKLRDQSPDVFSAKVRGQLVGMASHPGGEGPLGQAVSGWVQTPALPGSSRLTLSKLQSALCHLRMTHPHCVGSW